MLMFDMTKDQNSYHCDPWMKLRNIYEASLLSVSVRYYRIAEKFGEL